MPNKINTDKVHHTLDNSCRVFTYNTNYLPNKLLKNKERGIRNLAQAIDKTGLSIGYPAWNLLYYCVLCSMPTNIHDHVILVETGTHMGFSTIILAQALKDSNRHGCIYTVDSDQEKVKQAQMNVKKAGLNSLVNFSIDDSITFLQKLAANNSSIQFAFLDSNHDTQHVLKEFACIHPLIVKQKGSVYFDNTQSGGVKKALEIIKTDYSGNLVKFNNCSWQPPGNAIWQP